MKLLYNHDKYMKIKSHVGGDYNKFNGGFPNLIKNVENEKKKEYQYNIDNILETEKINIKNILTKRKEETKPLIDLDLLFGGMIVQQLFMIIGGTQGIQKHICLIHLKLLLRQKYFLTEIIRIDILNPEILLLQETKWEVMF